MEERLYMPMNACWENQSRACAGVLYVALLATLVAAFFAVGPTFQPYARISLGGILGLACVEPAYLELR